MPVGLIEVYRVWAYVCGELRVYIGAAEDGKERHKNHQAGAAGTPPGSPWLYAKGQTAPQGEVGFELLWVADLAAALLEEACEVCALWLERVRVRGAFVPNIKLSLDQRRELTLATAAAGDRSLTRRARHAALKVLAAGPADVPELRRHLNNVWATPRAPLELAPAPPACDRRARAAAAFRVADGSGLRWGSAKQRWEWAWRRPGAAPQAPPSGREGGFVYVRRCAAGWAVRDGSARGPDVSVHTAHAEAVSAAAAVARAKVEGARKSRAYRFAAQGLQGSTAV